MTEQNRTPVVNQKSTLVQAQHYEGPIPPPEMLEKYNQIVSGAADRILKMAEEQASHRQYLEKQVIKSDIRNSVFGIISALIISLATLFIAFSAIKLNQQFAGAIISTLGISGLVTTFIYGTQSRRNERESRNKQE
jgi:uncharacterized membrane protein